jgi:hypothetical protein
MRQIWVFVVLLAAAGCSLREPTPPPGGPAVAPARPPAFDGLAELAEVAAPERDAIREGFRYDRAIRPTPVPGLRYFFYEPDGREAVVGFALQNTGSPTINPKGLRKTGPRREFAFLFADRARENIHLEINDDVKLSGRFSHDNMFREWLFFPRTVLPRLQVDQATGVIEVTLPTGEAVRFDLASKEIVGGVLSESPVDFNRSRHQRNNPRVRYQGDYLAITVAQRGEAPRRATVWGQTKFAEVYYPAMYPRPCRLSPRLLWDQAAKPGDTDPKLNMLHVDDDRLFRLVERRCGWDLAALRTATRRMAEAEAVSP